MSNRDEVALNATKRIIKIISAPGPANQQQAKIQALLIDLLEKHSAPPAAAHGDEAVRKPELVGYFSFCEDKQKWLQQKPKGVEFNHLFTPLYAMRAQAGEGGDV